MESKLNSNPKNHLKFSSNLFSRPFSSNVVYDENIPLNKDQYIIEEITSQLDNDISQGNDPNNITACNPRPTNLNLDVSASSIMKNDSLLNSSTTSNNLSSSTTSFKKRKPFDKLSFHKDNTNLAENPTNISFTPSNINDTSNIIQVNKSNITNDEKSMILSSYKLLSKNTLEKAKLFNSQYKNSTPFWIKFFEEIESDTLKSNSSYYKVNNKSEYVKNLIEMVQRDADIYDSMNKSNVTKKATENSIKQILNEAKRDNTMNCNANSILEPSPSTTSITSNNSKISYKSKQSQHKQETQPNNHEENNTNTQVEIENKLENILKVYNKIDEKNKKFYSNENNYEQFKFNLLTGGKFNNDNKINKEPDNTSVNDNIINKVDKQEEEKQKQLNQNQKKQFEIKEFKTIDSLYFGENYTFEELNYDKIDFTAFEPSSIKKLLALDRRLHELDPERYTTSINTELKQIQDKFNKGKKERYDNIEKETREKITKFLNENYLKQTKKSIFDVQPKDEKKIKYKDYLSELKEEKKQKKLLDTKFTMLDQQLKQCCEGEISQDKKDKLNKELEDFHSTEEFKNKFENMCIPGKSQLNKINEDLKVFENKNKELMEDIENLKILVKIEEDKQKKRTKEEEERYHNEVIIPFRNFQQHVNGVDKQNKELFGKLEKLEEKQKEEENKLNRAQEKLDKLLQGREAIEKLFEEADKIFYQDDELKNMDNNIIEQGKQNTLKEIIETKGEDENENYNQETNKIDSIDVDVEIERN